MVVCFEAQCQIGRCVGRSNQPPTLRVLDAQSIEARDPRAFEFALIGNLTHQGEFILLIDWNEYFSGVHAAVQLVEKLVQVQIGRASCRERV